MLSCSAHYPGSFLQPESRGVATNGEYGTVHPCRFSSFTSTRSFHSVTHMVLLGILYCKPYQFLTLTNVQNATTDTILKTKPFPNSN